MADVTINQLSEGLPNKNSAVIPYSDGSTTYKTSPSGIVAASPGSVLQVVSINNQQNPLGQPTIGPSINTNTTVMQLTIKPRFNTSKILIDCGMMLHRENGTSSTYYDMSLWRDASRIVTFADAALYQSLGNGARDFYSTTCLDTPNTTDSLTYFVKSSKIAPNDGSYYCTACFNGICFITLKEIAG